MINRERLTACTRRAYGAGSMRDIESGMIVMIAASCLVLKVKSESESAENE